MYFFYGWTGRKKEKTPEKALTLTDKYNEVVARLQQSNKFRILLDQYADAQMHEGEIKEWLRKNGTRYDADKLCTAFDYVKEYYGRDLRKDGKTPKAAHALSVARGVAILGGDFESVLGKQLAALKKRGFHCPLRRAPAFLPVNLGLVKPVLVYSR